MYFKAEICLATETLDTDGSCIGDYQDHGIISQVTAPTIEMLKIKLLKIYNFDNAEMFENRVEQSFENNGQLESFTTYITQVIETEVDASILEQKE